MAVIPTISGFEHISRNLWPQNNC